MNRCCVINFADKNYINGRKRLIESIQLHSPDIAVLSFKNESELGAPKHSENPYAFKCYAFQRAIELGYEYILWLDASCYAIKPLNTIFDVIKKEGYIMQEAGHRVGYWCNEFALDYFDLTRQKANGMLMYGNAGFLGLNMSNKISKDFLSQWRLSADNGCFKGDWSNHRHDMTCGSIIANRLGMKYKSGNEWLAYAAPEDQVNETIIIKAQGIN